MAISKLNIVNMGLVLSGANTLTSLSDNTKAAKLANQFFEISYRSMAEMPYNWKFLTTRAELTEITPATNQDFGSWGYAFALPNDCLRMIAQVDGDDDFNYYDYRREVINDSDGTERDVIWTNESECYIKYIKDRFNAIGSWPGWFIRIVALDLAILVVEPLKKDTPKKNQLLSMMVDPVNGWLAKAVAANGMEDDDTNADGERMDDGNREVLDASIDEELTRKYIQTR